MLESLFNKKGLKLYLILLSLQYRCFPLNNAKFLRTTISKKIERLLLLRSRLFSTCFISSKRTIGRELVKEACKLFVDILRCWSLIRYSLHLINFDLSPSLKASSFFSCVDFAQVTLE